tara:strand:- start:90 stop:485 length:396 start_codon:yes stop_codon:yes gene_type:complete
VALDERRVGVAGDFGCGTSSKLWSYDMLRILLNSRLTSLGISTLNTVDVLRRISPLASRGEGVRSLWRGLPSGELVEVDCNRVSVVSLMSGSIGMSTLGDRVIMLVREGESLSTRPAVSESGGPAAQLCSE